jgi:predicted TIM-barrel fold metal-dependent hydrolase
MTQLCLAPDPDPVAPSFAMPAGATDCHMHAFGTAPDFPYVDDRDYTPPEAGVTAARKLYKALGIERIVVIQPSVYGADNRCQLAFGAALGLPVRAIIVPDANTTEADLDKFHAQGARGIRYILAHPGGLDLASLERTADGARERGWHLEFLIKPALLVELEARLAKLSCPVSFDHLAFVNPRDGVAAPAFQALLRLLRGGNGWAKFSGAYRASGAAEDYAALPPMARAMIDANPDRIVWGSDWPHVGQMAIMPRTTPLLNLLQDWAPDEALRRKILVDNASKLYGFE